MGLHDELRKYGANNSYVPTQFLDVVCARCKGREVVLALDDLEGVAVVYCARCGEGQALGDSEDFLDEAELEDCECTCGSPLLEVTLAVALYEGSDAVRWLYVGASCPACGLGGCYGDWKNEYDDWRELFARPQ